MLDRRIRIKATHDFDDFFNRAYAIQRVSLCVPAGEKKARPRLLTNLV
jgi:selenocysteine-specific translation elongation factor